MEEVMICFSLNEVSSRSIVTVRSLYYTPAS